MKTPKPKLKFQGVYWNIPDALYQELQNAKIAGQAALDVPSTCETEEFGMFILNMGVVAYNATLQKLKPEPLIMTPDQYVGQRTPKR